MALTTPTDERIPDNGDSGDGAPSAPCDPSALAAGRGRRITVFLLVAAVLIALDQVTKSLALTHLSNGRRVSLVNNQLGLRLLRNPGASLGMGSGATGVISLLAIAACVALCYLVWRTASMRWAVALSFCFAGAFGNLIDRVIYADGFLNGRVVDFIDYGWSVGNVADIELTVAAVAIVLLVVFDVPFGVRKPEAAACDDGASDGTSGDGTSETGVAESGVKEERG